MKRSRLIGAVAAALVAGLVLGGAGISMAGTQTAAHAPNANANGAIVSGATTPAVGLWGQPSPSKAVTVALAPYAKHTAARAHSSAPSHRVSTRNAIPTTRRTATRCGSANCDSHDTNHHGTGGCGD